jgi:hypothetical protein
MISQTRADGISRLNCGRYLLVGLDEGRSSPPLPPQKKNKKEETRDELLARILDADACVKKRDDQHRRKTRDQ